MSVVYRARILHPGAGDQHARLTPLVGESGLCGSDSTHTSSRWGDRAFKGPHDPIFDGCREPKKNKRHIAISGMLALGVHGVRFKRDLVTSLVSQKCED